MALLEAGRVCRALKGKIAGKYCIISAKKEGRYLVDGVGFKGKKLTKNHLEPTPWKADGIDAEKALSKLKLI
jgi:ribosomal protein L14E/L6E/L27E